MTLRPSLPAVPALQRAQVAAAVKHRLQRQAQALVPPLRAALLQHPRRWPQWRDPLAVSSATSVTDLVMPSPVTPSSEQSSVSS